MAIRCSQYSLIARHKGKKGDGYFGRLEIEDGERVFKGQIALAPVPSKWKETSPDYDVMFKADGDAGAYLDYGSAWQKTTNAGAPFVTISFRRDDVHFEMAAFLVDGKSDQWRITMNKPRGAAKKAASATAADAVSSDQIPF